METIRSLRRAQIAPWILLAVAGLLLVPLIARPKAAIELAVAALIVVTASRSIAVPLGLAGFAAPVIALLGHDPFPRGGAPLILFLWIVLSMAITGSSELFQLRGLATSTAVVLTLALLALLILRLPASSDPSYAHFKLEIFVLSDVTLLAAGLLLGRRYEQIDLFLVLALLIDSLSGLLVLGRFGSAAATTDRFGLPTQNVIALGLQGAQGLMIATYLMLRGSRTWQRLLSVGLLPFTVIALLASGSRGPVLGGALGVLAMLVLLSGTRTSALRIFALFGCVAVAGIAALHVVPVSASSRALSTITGVQSGLSGNGRSQLWAAAWSTFTSHPALGIGTGSFATAAREEVCPGPGCRDRYPHNAVLEVAAELGIAGVAILGAFLFFGGRTILGVWRRAPETARVRSSIVFGLFVSAVVTAMLTGDLSGNSAIWLAVGIGVGISSRLSAETAAA